MLAPPLESFFLTCFYVFFSCVINLIVYGGWGKSLLISLHV